jgi:CHAT domain-containing protein
MGARSIHKHAAVLPLLALLLVGASAATIAPERAIALARKAIDEGEVQRGETLINDALRIAAQDSEAFSTLRVMRAEVFTLRAEFKPAQDELAAELPAPHRHSRAAVQRLVYLAFAAHETKQGNERDLLMAAEEIATQHQPSTLPEVWRARTQLYEQIADGRKALALARKYGDRKTEAKTWATLARIHVNDGHFTDALDATGRALRLAKELRLANVIQNAEGTLGWAYVGLGDYETAADLFKSAEATAAHLGNRLNQSSWLVQIANVHFQMRDYARAAAFNRQALAIATRPLEKGFALANLARIAIEQRDFERARALNNQAREAKRAARDPDARLRSDIVDARILAAKERNFVLAEQTLLKVVENKSEGQRDVIRLEAESELAKLYSGWKPERAENAFAAAAATARKVRGKINGAPLRLSFYNTVSDLYDAYIDFLIERDPTKALEVAEESRAETLEEGRERNEARFDPKGIARKNGATILSYWLGRDRSYLWVVTAGGVAVHRLPSDIEIEDSVRMFQRLLRQNTSGSYGRRLYDLLVAPARIASGTRVIVVPDGLLHLVNFETLQAAPNRYWLEDVNATPSASMGILGNEPKKVSATPSLLLVGNAPSPDPAVFPPLKSAAKEMQDVASHFRKPFILAGRDATPAKYRAALPGKYDYIHFTAHAVAGSQRPLDSFIQLGPDGASWKLVASDIQNEPLNARLVTIASCEGAGKRTYAGEGVVGLAWAFLHAGADQVVASLWKAEDATTAKLMDDMYKGIAAGQDPAVALREAKRARIRDGAKPWQWAPFVLYAGT